MTEQLPRFADLPEGQVVITGPIEQEFIVYDEQGRPTGAVERTLLLYGEVKIAGLVHGKAVTLGADTPPEVIDLSKSLLTADIQNEHPEAQP